MYRIKLTFRIWIIFCRFPPYSVENSCSRLFHLGILYGREQIFKNNELSTMSILLFVYTCNKMLVFVLMAEGWLRDSGPINFFLDQIMYTKGCIVSVQQ